MSGLACVPCRVFFVPLKNGVVVEEGKPLTNAKDGPWGPYKLWRADLVECPKCGTQVITGFAPTNFSEHFMDDYEQQKAKYPPMVRIDACVGLKP